MKDFVITILVLLAPFNSSFSYADNDKNKQNGQELAAYYPDQILKMDIDSDDTDEVISLLTADVDGDTGVMPLVKQGFFCVDRALC